MSEHVRNIALPRQLVYCALARELADSLKLVGQPIPRVMESMRRLRPWPEDKLNEIPNEFQAFGVLLGYENEQMGKQTCWLGTFPGAGAATQRCRGFLEDILEGIYRDGMDAKELVGWAERFSLGAFTLPASSLLPRVEIAALAAVIVANHSLETQPTNTI